MLLVSRFFFRIASLDITHHCVYQEASIHSTMPPIIPQAL